MGIGQGVDSMSTTTDVIYTHKKFKRAAAESWESNEAKKVQQRQSEYQHSPTSAPSQKEQYQEGSNHLTYNGHEYGVIDKEVPEEDAKLVCGRCVFSCNSHDVFNQHDCSLSESSIQCPRCKQVFKKPCDYEIHRCVVTNIPLEIKVSSGATQNEIQRDLPVLIPVDKTSHVQRVIYNRSHSFPGQPEFKHVDERYFEKISDSVSLSDGIKQIYKPKFRAKYSFQESPSKLSHTTVNSSNCLQKVKQELQRESSVPCTTGECLTYHSSTTASLLSPSLSQLSTIQGKPLTSFDLRNQKIEEFSLSKGATSQCSNIWKGIKSPSPELVGQHITNLIVQNQAIVETHNPLFSMKYRRQSSAISSHTENEGGTNQRTRKLSDNLRAGKTQSSNLYSSSYRDSYSDNHGATSVSSVCSLPRSSFTYSPTQSSSPIRASKNISSPLSTSSHHKVKTIESSPNLPSVHYEFATAPGSSIKNFPSVIESTSESLDLSKAALSKTESTFHCGKCDTLLLGNESKDQHLKHCYQKFYTNVKVSDVSVKSLKVKRPEEQEVALDLQKKKENFYNQERAPYNQEKTYNHEKTSYNQEKTSYNQERTFYNQERTSYNQERTYNQERAYIQDRNTGDRELSAMSEPVYQQLQPVSNNHAAVLLSRSFHPSPPLKRRKIFHDTFNQDKTYSSLFPQNGRMITNKNDFMKMYDEFGKPRGNSHHLYGGEVKICDGKEMKTLKIDPTQSEAPSLDLCIASKHFGVDIESREPQIPTSVVVTITKGGLNSGGTMVKLENQNSGSYTTRKLDVNLVSVNNNNCVTKSQAEQIISLSSQPVGGIISPISIHSPLIQYKTHDLSSENLTAIPLRLLKGPSPAISILPKIHSPIVNSIQETYGAQGLVKNTSPLPYKEADPEPVQKAVHSYFPSVLSIGDEVVPYVPGIPGPYSQANVILKNPNTDAVLVPVSAENLLINASVRLTKPTLYSPTSTVMSLSPINTPVYSSINSCSTPVIQSIEHSKPKELINSSLCPPKVPVKSHSVVSAMPKPPEIRIHPAPLDMVVSSKCKVDDNNKEKSICDAKQVIDDENTFLMPRKRPNTLVIKPQTFNVKSSLALIGSTLVSPDTPRPKKSCAQLFLNGSAYTYLNLKVSTKTFFCCIYRPQPMYVLQSTNPKLSMYSNWQVRKTEDPLNISPSEAMGLHVSSCYYNKAYTIAKPKIMELTVTDSSYWTQKDNKLNKKATSNFNKSISSTLNKKDNEVLNKVSELKVGKNKEERSNIPSPKRVKIFEGGFKTNEDYTYVRGRGRGRYVCETCGIRCKKPSMLKKHIRTHTDLRPFSCKHCSFSFKTKGNLTKHLKSKAHFKRCTEMGIVPVPITVNESHVNQDAAHLPGMMEHGKDLIHNMYDDEDDDDEEEEEEEDEDDDDDDDDEDDDDYEDEDDDSSSAPRNDFKIMKAKSDFYHTNSTPVSSDSSYPSISEENCSSFPSESLKPVPHSANTLRAFKADGNVDDTIPMDLSIKRPSVITVFSSHHDSSVGSEFSLRPDHLSLPKRSLNDSKKSTATTSIKENAKDILSPVTESSMILQSIYNTTLQVSSSKSSENDPMRDASCGAMLQTYLTERAVLDSTRKRYQYLQSSSEEQSLINVEELNLSPSTSLHNRPSCSISHSRAPSPVKPAAVETAPISLPSRTEAVLSSESITNATVVSTQSTSQLSVATSNICPSSTPPLKSVVKSTYGGPANSVALSLTAVTSAVSSGGSTVITTSSKSASELRLGRSGRRVVKNSSALISSASSMPTPPVNLTVINNCGGDTKTAFIAPSGVIPSPHNSRLGADDGKCRCSVCHREFAKQGQLRLHINIHYIERPHRCDPCNISFRTNGHLQKHTRSVSHFNKVNMNMTFGTPSTDNPRPFKCHDCKIAFRIYGHLAKHLRSKLHIMKLECLGKLPFGTYAEIERSGVNLNEIDTSDCENSLESLQLMASKLYEKDPSKLQAWQAQQQQQQQQDKKQLQGKERERTISSSSNNSEDYSLLDEQECGTPSSASTGKSNEEESGDEDDPAEMKLADASSSTPPPLPPSSSSLSPCEVGSKNSKENDDEAVPTKSGGSPPPSSSDSPPSPVLPSSDTPRL